MPDITKCEGVSRSGQDCPVKATCYRYTVPAEEMEVLSHPDAFYHDDRWHCHMRWSVKKSND